MKPASGGPAILFFKRLLHFPAQFAKSPPGFSGWPAEAGLPP